MVEFTERHKATFIVIASIAYLGVIKWMIHFDNKSLCEPLDYKVIAGVTYCQCLNGEKQKPNKCGDKYK